VYFDSNAAVGAALLSKYTALFFGPAILIWLEFSAVLAGLTAAVVVRRRRRMERSFR